MNCKKIIMYAMDRDEKSAVHILKRCLAWLELYTDDSVRRTVAFTAIDDVNVFEHR